MKTEKFYRNLQRQLEDQTSFPSEYMYKFILKTSNEKITELQECFDGMRPQFSFRESKTKQFTSITVMVYVLDAEQVINGYKKATKVEGIISL